MVDKSPGAGVSSTDLDAKSSAGTIRRNSDRDSAGLGDRHCGLPDGRTDWRYPVTVAVSGLI